VPNDALILGLTGIVGSAAAGPYFAARFALARERERFLHEERLADREELRERLDEAAEVLQRAIAAHRRIYAAVEVHGEAALERDKEAPEHLNQSRECANDLSAMADRLAMRLTIVHDLYNAFEESGRAEAQAAASIWSMALGLASVEEAKRDVASASQALSNARSTLTVEARKLVRVHLPAPGPSSRSKHVRRLRQGAARGRSSE
jgi:hypothetical protein